MDKIKVEMDEGIVLSELIEFMGDKFDVEDVVRSGGDGVYELFYGCRGGYEGITKNDMMDELDDNNIDNCLLEVRDVFGKDIGLNCMLVVMYGEEDVRVFVDVYVD